MGKPKDNYAIQMLCSLTYYICASSANLGNFNQLLTELGILRSA